jgi:excisionase family DNA binding protein
MLLGATMTTEIGILATDVLQSSQRSAGANNHVPDWPSWSIEQAAEETGFNPEYIRRLCRAGHIVHERLGRTYLVQRESMLAYKARAEKERDARFGPRRPGRS